MLNIMFFIFIRLLLGICYENLFILNFKKLSGLKGNII